MSHQHIKYTERKNKACQFQILPNTCLGFGAITVEIRKFLRYPFSLNYASTCMQQALSAVNRPSLLIIFIIHVRTSFSCSEYHAEKRFSALCVDNRLLHSVCGGIMRFWTLSSAVHISHLVPPVMLLKLA